MNNLVSWIAIILFLCINSIPEVVHGNPVNANNFAGVADKGGDVTVSSVDFVLDGGSIMIECASGDLRFKILLLHPNRKAPVSFVKVYTFADPSNPNVKTEILPDSPEEMKLIKVFSNILKVGSAPKFEANVKTAIKYISDRKLPWVSSDWIRPK